MCLKPVTEVIPLANRTRVALGFVAALLLVFLCLGPIPSVAGPGPMPGGAPPGSEVPGIEPGMGMPVGAPAGGPPMPPMPPGGAPPAMPPGAEVPGVGPGMGMPGAMPGMGGAMPGAGVAAAAPAGPPEKTITYQQYLDESGSPPNPVLPEYYKKQKRTSAEWHQLFRIYPARAALAVGRRVQPGASLYQSASAKVDRERKELEAVQRAYDVVAKNAFSFEYTYPSATASVSSPDTASVQVSVICRANPKWANRAVEILKKYSAPGQGRQPLNLATYRNGYMKPVTVFLCPEAVSRWQSLWNQDRIEVKILDAAGNTIQKLTTSAGHGPDFICQLAVQPEIVRPDVMQMRKHPDRRWNGGNKKVDYTRGWLYQFNFSLPMGRLADLDKIEAKMATGTAAPGVAAVGAAVGGPMGGLPGAGPPMPGGGGPPGAMPPGDMMGIPGAAPPGAMPPGAGPPGM